MPKPSKLPILLSLALHGCLIGALFYFLQHAVLYSLPQKNALVLQAYLSREPQNFQKNNSKPKLTLNAATPLRPKLAHQNTSAKTTVAKPLQSTKLLATQTPTSTTQPQKLAPKQIQQLLTFISKQIQLHLQYPQVATTHIEQGESTVQFELMPNGDLQDIQIMHSSENIALDQAALTAVIASSPVKIPKSLPLRHALTLRIPVIFKIQ